MMERYKKVIGVIVVVFVLIGIFALVFLLNISKSGQLGIGMVDEVGMESYPRESSMMKSASTEAPSGQVVRNDGVSLSSEESPVPTEQKIIREANLSIRVDSADKAVDKFRGVADWYKGVVSSVNLRENVQGVRSGMVVLKVPTESFDSAIRGVKEEATVVVQETISNQDVTEEFVDMEAHLKNKKAEEEAFTKVLGQAEKTTDIIAVTRELSRVRGEIEALEGRLRYMESRTQLATISIQLSEDLTVSFVDTWRPWQEVKDTANELLKSMQGFVSFVIIFLIWFLPLVIVYGALLLVLWFVVRGAYRKFRRTREIKSK